MMVPVSFLKFSGRSPNLFVGRNVFSSFVKYFSGVFISFQPGQRQPQLYSSWTTFNSPTTFTVCSVLIKKLTKYLDRRILASSGFSNSTAAFHSLTELGMCSKAFLNTRRLALVSSSKSAAFIQILTLKKNII